MKYYEIEGGAAHINLNAIDATEISLIPQNVKDSNKRVDKEDTHTLIVYVGNTRWIVCFGTEDACKAKRKELIGV